jgi:hypothetical protein
MWGVINLLAERHTVLLCLSTTALPSPTSSLGLAVQLQAFSHCSKSQRSGQVRRGGASASFRPYLSATASALVVGATDAAMKSSRQPCEQK